MLYSKTNAKPNKKDVAQILDLEFKARRAFIDSDATKEEDRAEKIMDAYPCFKDPHHVSHFELLNFLAVCLICYFLVSPFPLTHSTLTACAFMHLADLFSSKVFYILLIASEKFRIKFFAHRWQIESPISRL